MPKSKNRRKKPRSGKHRTPIDGHTRAGKTLHPPFAQVSEKLTFSSWANERLPEMIWAAIIRVLGDQDYAIAEFRRILGFIGDHKERGKLCDITLTGIARLDEDLRDDFIRMVVETELTATGLATLTLFRNLPARDSWLKHLPDVSPSVDLLMAAVGFNLDHQSQEATDCRWLRLMAQVVSGKMRIPESTAKRWFGYPYDGDQRAVRPSIRAAEIATNPFQEKDLAWPDAFWDETWRNTPCFMLGQLPEIAVDEELLTRGKVTEVSEALQEHWHRTHTTTAINAKHDCVFGIAFYSLRIVDELLGVGNSTGVLGRLGLRTILECYISLHYLLDLDDESLWKKWRAYGAGQAKLNSLRFDFDAEPPKHIDVKVLEQIAGEDLWDEFLSIELGSWSGKDLRKLSEKAGLKDIYDQHYSWTSGYVHGTWGPVRESGFQTCGNPLHRLHRYPSRNALPDVLHDGVVLVDAILDDLSRAYPTFPQRLQTDPFVGASAESATGT
jgi:hypothetical protein